MCPGGAGGGEYSLIWPLRGCAPGQRSLVFDLSVLNRVYNLRKSVLIINKNKFVCTPCTEKQ